MLDTPFPTWPDFSDKEAKSIGRVLLSNRVNYWTGRNGKEFESEFARYVESSYAVALANGTVALDLALNALGIGAGDEVVVTPRTFLASASSIVNSGARPVFADIDPDSQNLARAAVEPRISAKTKAIVCVHHAGWPCDMNDFRDLARNHSIALIEDCAQAHGAAIDDKPVGAFGDVGAWSFCQDKIMTTGGEGGMVTTNDEELWARMWSFKDHGKSFDAVYNREHPPGFRWVHESFGTNWRMTEMQAAIGRIQLKRMPEWHKRRVENAKSIWRAAAAIPGIRVPGIPDYVEHAAYKCYVFVRPNALKKGWDRDRIMAEINDLGVPCYSGGCPEVYLEKAFDNTGFRPEKRLPVAKELGETSLMFLCHPTLEERHIEQTCDALRQVMSRATR